MKRTVRSTGGLRTRLSRSWWARCLPEHGVVQRRKGRSKAETRASNDARRAGPHAWLEAGRSYQAERLLQHQSEAIEEPRWLHQGPVLRQPPEDVFQRPGGTPQGPASSERDRAETADSILLYAANVPSFVVDAYTKRVFSRHGLIAPDADYNTVQKTFMDSLPADVRLYNEFHALIVRVSKDYCRGTPPLCTLCPLVSFLPGAPARSIGGSNVS